ncbi:N-alpha-acetyl diaminobutyric acid deacetylase DoeB [Caballeronia sp. EK]|uniref:N(2)-acetyl-L-2,4-diaminobutanoate deacetylase DoeB n=1 Tax=Caballeronia sp. EK TaxID=2767469 RepID=UPI0016553BB3|nr:N(2)-acetyl-L-2,4-diaminobutanoate deacetylase DoeB [Caballeronia sp. EK]MBC8641639.1 N-alpha-acetyl diaminobutyric acid deacetylase DoeB [Caballeronia sp. EK]
MRESSLAPTIDLDANGERHGFLKLPYSRDDSAWGAVMIPLSVIKNGSGPTVLLTGGNHGDEYEGPIALAKLASSLKASDVSGRVIVVPYMNYPAFEAGSRTSPIDKGNLNRSFPGRPDGAVTEKIADFFQRYLLPSSDFVLDIHSGGRTLEFLPFAAIHVLRDQNQQARCEQAMYAFAAPYSMKMLELDAVGMFDTAVEEAGKVFVSTELGGGGSSTARSVAIADRGIRGFLANAGVVEHTETSLGVEDSTTLLDMPDGSCYVTSELNGLLEQCIDLGALVRQGDVIARIHDIGRTGTPAVECLAKRDGLLAARHFPGLVKRGDTVAVVADIVVGDISPRR